VISGPNGAGKTSVLEAIAYLGRGKSFRSAGIDKLIRHGCGEFVLNAEVDRHGLRHRVGVRNGREGLEVRIDGENGAGAADLASLLPLQVVDPDVHNLVAGGPEERRRYLDWMTFHVEPGYLERWRRFRRVLRQRNAVLKEGPRATDLDAWDRELIDASIAVTRARQSMFATAAPVIEEVACRLLQAGVGLEYRQGWPDGSDLAEVLKNGRDRDIGHGSTQAGPHRAELRLRFDERQARKLVSRGQQKLLACALVIGSVEVAQQVLGEGLLLLDDPSAELDAGSVARLMECVEGLGSQVVATSLDGGAALFSTPARLFHVEQGALSRRG